MLELNEKYRLDKSVVGKEQLQNDHKVEELSTKIESMLETVLEEEREFIDELCLEEEYDDIEDIPIDETEGFWDEREWQTRRNYEYICEKRSILIHLKEQLSILTAGTDAKKMHRAKKELEEIITNARNFNLRKREDIDAANEVIDVMDNVIGICQNLVGKKK